MCTQKWQYNQHIDVGRILLVIPVVVVEVVVEDMLLYSDWTHYLDFETTSLSPYL
jgi:hypothetical protein